MSLLFGPGAWGGGEAHTLWQACQSIAERLLGKRCFVGWPFLVEALVTRISDGYFTYRRSVPSRMASAGSANAVAGPQVVQDPVDPEDASNWESLVGSLENAYSRRGIKTGPIHVVLSVRPFKVHDAA